jgi:hypothetical protein
VSKIYISGPITSRPDTHREDFRSAAESLIAAGYRKVVDPHDVPACPGDGCGGSRVNGAYRHTWECYLRHDLAALLTLCDSVAVLPGWQESPGARFEVDVATQLRYVVEPLTYWLECAGIPRHTVI